MYEFHGFATIRDVYSCSMKENDEFDRVVSELRGMIQALSWSNGLADLRMVNGEYHFSISGFLNHKSAEVEDLFHILTFITENAVGSYGLLYTHDDEADNGESNEFIIYKLAKGKLTKEKDTLLSPFFNTVEEPE